MARNLILVDLLIFQKLKLLLMALYYCIDRSATPKLAPGSCISSNAQDSLAVELVCRVCKNYLEGETLT